MAERISCRTVLVAMACISLATTAQAAAQPDCIARGTKHEQLAREAMQAEIALLHRIRLELCPRDEALAVQSNALDASANRSELLDYDAYVRCRRTAETRLERSRPVLYKNRRGFTYYTAAGARLAREADALLLPSEQPCARSQER